MLDRLRIPPNRYALVTAAALIALTTIVLTGSAVRLTASGLGCPDWPKCYGGTVPPAQINAIIEYGNRIVTAIVGVAVIAACALVFLRRPFRWHLAVFAILLPLGVIGQAALGAVVVEQDLPPALVLCHFILSMMLIDAAFALFWCSRNEPGERRPSRDKLGVWSVRALIPIGQLTILAGTVATASGPHPGDHNSELVHRFDFKGADTLAWVVERHAAVAIVFGIAAMIVVALLMRSGGDRRAVKPLLLVVGLLGSQGVIGITQWLLHLPAALVWVHVAVAVFTWLAMLWSVAAAGLLEPEAKALRERDGLPMHEEPQPAGSAP